MKKTFKVKKSEYGYNYYSRDDSISLCTEGVAEFLGYEEDEMEDTLWITVSDKPFKVDGQRAFRLELINYGEDVVLDNGDEMYIRQVTRRAVEAELNIYLSEQPVYVLFQVKQ